MSSTLPPAGSVPGPGMWRIVGGISFMLGWALLHVILFYALAVSGILVDILLVLIKSVMFPGASHTAAGAHEVLGWESQLRTGLILAGMAGLPGGLAFFMAARRRLLWGGFLLLLLAGFGFEIYAFGILVRNASHIPA